MNAPRSRAGQEGEAASLPYMVTHWINNVDDERTRFSGGTMLVIWALPKKSVLPRGRDITEMKHKSANKDKNKQMPDWPWAIALNSASGNTCSSTYSDLLVHSHLPLALLNVIPLINMHNLTCNSRPRLMTVFVY